MVSNSTEARLKYLDTASKFLLVSSPALSAHLQAERDSTLHDGENEMNSSTCHRSCNACGTILIPGWSCKALRDARNLRNSHLKAHSKGSHPQLKRLRCSTCGAVSNFEIDGQQQTELKTSDQPVANHAVNSRKTNTYTIAPLQSKTNNVKVSNRRARSKKSSLQSMLADQKKADSDKPKRFGMDLADLMQP